MGESTGYLELIKQAQLGSRDSMSRLAKEAKERVSVYIYRVTLDYHLAQDLSQDTALEMIKSIKRLKIENVNSFWSWLYRTALGKVQHHFRQQRSKRIEQKIIAKRTELLNLAPQDCRSGLNTLLQKELSQVVLKAMSQLQAMYRNVLTLRCFDEMPYADIAKIMDVSEMRAMVLFFRAKRSLRKQLARNGFKKEQLLPAIGLFGAITASSTKPASAAVVVNSATAKVGITTAVIGTATSATGIITTIAAVIVMSAAIGTVKVFRDNIEASQTAGVTNQPEARKLQGTSTATIIQTSAPPVIDGDEDAIWSVAPKYKLTNVIYSLPSSPKDLSADFRAMWDANNLYMLIDVTDDVLVNDTRPYQFMIVPTGSTVIPWWYDDCVEVYIDADDSKSNQFDNDDAQYHFDWDRTHPTMGIHRGHGRIANIEYAIKTTEKGYCTEIKFPWATLGKKPSVGSSIGLDVHVDDDDDGGDRDSKITWCSKRDTTWNDPQDFKSAELVGLTGR
jgi:RNA polymerase sigma factor (sigma-70 family)